MSSVLAGLGAVRRVGLPQQFASLGDNIPENIVRLWEKVEYAQDDSWYSRLFKFVDAYAKMLRQGQGVVSQIPTPLLVFLARCFRALLKDNSFATMSLIFDAQQDGYNDLLMVENVVFIIRKGSKSDKGRKAIVLEQIVPTLAETLTTLFRLHNGMLSEFLSTIASQNSSYRGNCPDEV